MITGSGVLAGCVAELVGAGWHVVVPSRRHVPIPEPRGHEPGSSGRAIWVVADWSEPAALVERAGRALMGRADLLVAWLPASTAPGVLAAVCGLLRPAAPVVEVRSATSARQVRGLPEPRLPDHPTQQVVLGCVRDGGRARWLTSSEATEGVLAAMRRAIEGRRPVLHQVGELVP